jgi:hypothetical protein
VDRQAWEKWLDESITDGWSVGISLVQSNRSVLVASRKRVEPGDPLATKVTLIKPYPLHFAGDESDRITVQYAVIEVAKQAKLGYDWDASKANAGEVCRKFITPEIDGVPLREALDKILKPETLTYDIRDGKIVLKND